MEAHYTFCCDWHDGQSSTLYAKLCHIRKYFKPSPLFNGYDSLSDNGKAIYDHLVAKMYPAIGL